MTMSISELIESTRSRAINENEASDWLSHAENCLKFLRQTDLPEDIRNHLADESLAALLAVRELTFSWNELSPEEFVAAGIEEPDPAEVIRSVRLIDVLCTSRRDKGEE